MATRSYRRTIRWGSHPRLVRSALAATLALAPTGFSSPSTDHQWALQFLSATKIWQLTRGGGVRVAVIDTGVQPGADLSNNLSSGADFSDTTGANIGDGLIDTDSYGHGTGEASLIAGEGSASGVGILGLAPAVTIVPVRAS